MRDVDDVNQRLVEVLRQYDVELAGIFVCPHSPDDGCLCRKPKVGLVKSAAQELGLDLAATFVIGDRACDIELGHNLGSCTFLVSGSPHAFESDRAPDFVVANLMEAADIIEQKLIALSDSILGDDTDIVTSHRAV